MKQYEVKILTDSHAFTCACNSISEAYHAVCDVVGTIVSDIDLDWLMESLVKMKRGELDRVKLSHMEIRAVDVGK